MKNAPALSRRARQRQLGCMRLRLPWAALLLTAATALALVACSSGGSTAKAPGSRAVTLDLAHAGPAPFNASGSVGHYALAPAGWRSILASSGP